MSIQEQNIIDYDVQILLYRRSIASESIIIAISCFFFMGCLALTIIGSMASGKPGHFKPNYPMLISGITGMVSSIFFTIIGIKLLNNYWEKCGLQEEELLKHLTKENQLHLIS